MANEIKPNRKPLIVSPEQGRTYDMGRMRAVFFGDGEETDNKYSISEWFLDARTNGPGPHSHDEDHIYYILKGTLSLFLEGERNDLVRGSYVVIPGGLEHDFENHGTEECGFLAINIPAGFETMLPSLVSWFKEKPLRSLD